MDRFDDWWSDTKSGFGQGVGDVARAAISDVGTAYQQILTQDSGIGPPAHLTGDMVSASEPWPAPATDNELQALIDAQEIGQQAETEMIEQETAPASEPSMEPG